MKLSRRQVLRGLGGIAVGLPLLEGLAPRNAWAQSTGRPKYAVFLREANGVAQAANGEPERFWPKQVGPITRTSLAADTTRATSVLADYADKLLIVRGLRFAFPEAGCGHSGGGNQVLTAARITGSGAGSLAAGESVDNRIARELNPTGVEPITLYAGRMGGYLDEVLSYSAPGKLRSAEQNPWRAYSRLMGISGADQTTQDQLRQARKSVNDVVRAQIQALQSSPLLSSADQDRLDQHFSSIRDLEMTMGCRLPDIEAAAMEQMGTENRWLSNDNTDEVAMMQMDVIALAFSCGTTHAATLQIGEGNDHTQWIVNGTKYPPFHFVSHRVQSDGETGTTIADAALKHSEIDKIHLRIFAHLIDKLTQAGILDDTAAVFCNDMAHGVTHGYGNVPFIVAGSLGGYLKQGQYVDAGNVTHNRFFNTLLNGMGIKKADGTPIDNFGDSSLTKGELAMMKA